MAPTPPRSIAELFIGFLSIGARAFGGVLPWAHRVLVEERKWVAPADFAEMIALCQFLPGPNIVNMSIAVGAKFRGVQGALDPRSYLIATYALCGFANLGTIGIELGGIGSLAPGKKAELARLGFRAMLAGTMANLMSACIAGMLL